MTEIESPQDDVDLLDDRPVDVEIRRNGPLSLVVGLAGCGLAIAFLWRATVSGSPLDIAFTLVMAIIGVIGFRAMLDAATPLLIADELGVRIRLGREWRGLPWAMIDEVEVQERGGWFTDGRVFVRPTDVEGALANLDAAGVRHVRLAARWYGDPLAVPLSLSTRCSTKALGEDLAALASGRSDIVALADEPALAQTSEPVVEQAAAVEDTSFDVTPSEGADLLTHDDESVEQVDSEETAAKETPRVAAWSRVSQTTAMVLSRMARGRARDVDTNLEEGPGESPEKSPEKSPEANAAPASSSVPEPVLVAERVEPMRATRRAMRAESTSERSVEVCAPMAEPTVTADSEEVVANTTAADDASASTETADAEGGQPAPVSLAAVAADSTSPTTPGIGAQLAAARDRTGLRIDELSERTRIRPHVLESIEADDFDPCGGDFYARGHIRSLARYLGLDAEELVNQYDARYAQEPINPTRVFQAELASSGSSRSLRDSLGGPRWSLMAAAVVALMMVWGLAQLLTNRPTEVANNSVTGQLSSTSSKPASLRLEAQRADAPVVVKDASGKVLWQGTLKSGSTREVEGKAPLTVKADNAGSVALTFNGAAKGTVGKPGTTATRVLGR